MGLLRAIFSFDRLFRRTPYIIEVWLLEFLTVIPLGLALGAWLDSIGAGGCAPDKSRFAGSTIGVAVFGLIFGFFAVRRILRPRVQQIDWTPVHTVKGALPVPLPVPQRSGRIRYEILSSHPSYAFVNLLILPIPLAGVISRSEGCSTSFFQLFGYATIALIALLIILRIVSWYGLRTGRAALASGAPEGMTPAEIEWALAWQPMIAMLTLVGLCILVPLGIVWLRVLLGYGT